MIGVNVVLILPFGTSRKGAYSGEDRDANQQNHVQRLGKIKRGLIEGRALTRISARNSYIYFYLLYR